MWDADTVQVVLQMTDAPAQSATPKFRIHLPAKRTAGLFPTAIGLPSGVFCLYLAWSVFARLDFRPSAVSSRLVECSAAFVAALLTIIGVVLLYVSGRWLLFSLWPGALGLEISDRHLSIRLGPFGRETLDLSSLTAQYRFEMPADEASTTEDFMDPEDQLRCCLPRLRHPSHSGAINTLLEKFIAGTPEEQLHHLRPVIDYARRSQN